MIDQRLLEIIGKLSEARHRTMSAKHLAQGLGAEDLIIFSKDPTLQIPLPAPGFPQTLYRGSDWRAFIRDCQGEVTQRALLSPYTGEETSALGIVASEGSVMVLLGGVPDLAKANMVVVLLPLIVSALATERNSIIAKGELEVENIYSQRAQVLANALDETRRSLEAELRKGASILNSITDAFFALDTDWRFIELNPQVEKILGRRRSDILGKPIWELFPSAREEKYFTEYQRAMRTQQPVFFEEYFPTSQSWYEVRAYPSKEGLTIYFNDINERKLAAEELRKSQDWFRTTLRSIGDGVITVNVDRIVTFMNPVAEKLTGWNSSEAMGLSIDEVFRIEKEGLDGPALNPVDLVLKGAAAPAEFFNQTVLVARNGPECVIESSAAAIRASDESISGVVLVFKDVTYKFEQQTLLKEAYFELRSERSRLEAILQQMPEGVLIAEPSGKLVLRNAQMDIMLGGFIPCDSIEDYGQYKGVRSDGRTYRSHEWPLARSLTTGEVIHGEEIELEKIDGSKCILSVSSSPILDETGKIVAGVVIHHDITQAKQVEADLRYQSYLTKTITDNAASALFMMDKSGHPTFMNPAARELTGYDSIEEISGKPLHYAVHWKKPDGNHYPMEECPIDNAQAELKKVRNQHEVFCTKTGKIFPVSYSLSPLEKNGEVTGSVLEFRDISEQKKFEDQIKQALSERDRSLDTLTTINRAGQRITAQLDLDTLVQQVTDDATRLTGAQFGAFFYNSFDEEGKSLLLSVVSGVHKEKFANFPSPQATEIFQPTFLGGGTIREADITEDPRFGKNPSYDGLPPEHLPVKSYLAVSVVSRVGEVIGGLFFGHEEAGVFSKQSEMIAEGLAAQAAVAMDNARLYRKVQDSVRARDEFLSLASHELKTPLTSLKLQSQIRSTKLARGQGDGFTADELAKMFENDNRQIDRLARLIDDMLNISLISTGKLSLQRENFDLCSVIKDVIERFSDQIQQSKSEVRVTCSEAIEGHWDRFRVEQVITNLLTNALKYGNHQPVEIRLRKDAAYAVLEVIDRGLGIPKDSQERIFDRFERAISANEISGLGLGLFIVKQIVDMHQGSIGVQSDPGKGAKFTVLLPVEKDSRSM